ncbi:MULTISPECIES: head maturation protease, ClpP-related [unclassified Enterococcus]|uniref:head maturation protease, ClpP-related n=1 Tax=unclassified Enterococcus TaxID=2608891 RepID=UPI0015552E98|nr:MULTISPECIES: head maturation protease, ClpP-related [unclassified Enterococcus]MBS7578298.1 Clp protease ClpP [Enterococcus sp. MMGLQ5-2]MBS7585491.1 Clp protease ClpP [Enterococcus sp. MMGLQ5-1]NPD13348.1 Clp protease ClpP [Enterococcus sp. MMGLQ5-1]NPD38129.1 Clp protease ClpP [Enterococcus sp. MMGLQ5-2]
MTKIKKVPFQFTNEIQNGKHILTLSGNVQKKYWRDDDVINAKDIRETLDTVTDDIVIKLNSPGGDVFEGIEIYNYLKDHQSNITVEVTGLAASAATFIVAGANEVIMNVGTSLMIHEASTFTWGNKQDIQKTLNALETIDDSILAIYSDKTGQSTDQLRDWMNEEKWFTADEAVKYGFADSVKRDEPQDEPKDITTMIQNAVAVAMANFEQPVTNQTEQEPKQKSLIARLRKGE